jgi:hypothetical protein
LNFIMLKIMINFTEYILATLGTRVIVIFGKERMHCIIERNIQ